jgi:hypothetical protein
MHKIQKRNVLRKNFMLELLGLQLVKHTNRICCSDAENKLDAKTKFGAKEEWPQGFFIKGERNGEKIAQLQFAIYQILGAVS